jgi:hypothetical protein
VPTQLLWVEEDDSLVGTYHDEDLEVKLAMYPYLLGLGMYK